MAKEDKTNLQHYIDIVQKVARVEHRRIPAHMVEYEELLSIGIIAIQVMIKNKTPEQLAKYNAAYIATAVRWAIRNELRIRYKWYSLKHKSDDEVEPEEAVDEQENAPGEQEAIPFEPEKPFDRISEFSVMHVVEQDGKTYWQPTEAAQ